jgi:hypothetical protein
MRNACDQKQDQCFEDVMLVFMVAEEKQCRQHHKTAFMVEKRQ